MKTLEKSLVLLIAWTLAVPARGADETFGFLEEEAMVLAAAKYPQRLSQAPAAASVITAHDIETYGYKTVGEALQQVPGFYLITDRNYSFLWVRGFGRPGDYNNRVLTLLNGHRLNDNIYGGVGLDRQLGLSMRDIERIEVVKGPGSALYGDSAFFAVVNVITREPEKAPAAVAAVSGGSYGNLEGFLSAARASGAGSFYASGSYQKMRGQDLYFPEYAASSGPDADREETYTGYVSVAKGDFRFQAQGNNRKKRIPTGAFSTRFGDPSNETSDSRNFAEAKWEKRFNPSVHVSARAYYDWYFYWGDYALDDASVPPVKYINHDESYARWYGGETQLRLTPFGRDHVLLVGQEYERTLEGWQLNYDDDPSAPSIDVDKRPYRWAAFAQQETRLHSRVRAVFGARYDRYELFGKSINPRGALMLEPFDRVSFKVLYGSAFRAPSVYEMFYGSGAGYLPNPNLQAERIHTLEVQAERKFSRGTASFGVFNNHIRDLINQTLVDPVAGTIQYINNERVRSHGFEAAAKGSFGAGWSGFAGWTVQETRSASGPRLSNSPRHTGTAGLNRTFVRWEAGAALTAFYVGRRQSFRGTDLRPVTLVGAQVSVRPWDAGPRIFAGVYNLGNARYEASGGAEHVQTAIRQDGRNFTVGMEQRFGK